MTQRHLGSTTLLTDSTGNVVQSISYLPYGEEWTEYNAIQRPDSLSLGQYRFNGKERDPESGFLYYGQRYYGISYIPMWLSVDPLLDKYPGISPYAYCLWNPIRLVDPDGRDVWVPDVNGNLIAENKDNSNTLAEYFNTTPQIAASMLREQGYIPDKNGVVFLKEGDVFEIDHGNIPHSRHTDLGIVGNAIRGLAGSGISQDMFSNYWNGDGDIVLTGSQFAGILSFVKANEHRVSNATNGTCLVNFYGNCSFERAYGRATLIKNNAGQIVGFQDTYNFDGKWGSRSLKNEIITRSVNFVSKLFGNVKNYDIRYP